MPPKGQRDAERSVTLTQNRKEVDPSTRQGNVCEAFGHTWLECPKGNKNMQKKEIARRAERQPRNGARAIRVVGALRVEELELEVGVNLKCCSMSLPHPLTLYSETLRIARTFCTQ